MFHSGLERQLGSGTSWRYLCDDGRPRRGQVWFGRRQETDDGPDPLDPRPYTPPDTGRTQLSRCWFASDLHLSLSLSLLTYPEFYFYFSLSLHLLLEILTVSTLNWFYNLFSLIFLIEFSHRPNWQRTVLFTAFSYPQQKQTKSLDLLRIRVFPTFELSDVNSRPFFFLLTFFLLDWCVRDYLSGLGLWRSAYYSTSSDVSFNLSYDPQPICWFDLESLPWLFGCVSSIFLPLLLLELLSEFSSSRSAKNLEKKSVSLGLGNQHLQTVFCGARSEAAIVSLPYWLEGNVAIPCNPNR